MNEMRIMSQPQSYAPTNTTSFTLTSYHEEVSRQSLFDTPRHKDVYNSFAEVYSILTVLEAVENAYIKDYITDKEKYTSTTLRLLNQYQIIKNGFQDQDKWPVIQQILEIDDLSQFLDKLIKKFDLIVPLAQKRITSGIPVTIEQYHHNNDVSGRSAAVKAEQQSTLASPAPPSNVRLIAETTSNFITCMDALKLNYRTKDQLHPLLTELVVNLNELVEDDSQFEFSGRSKLVNWLIKLNNLDDSLSNEEIELFLNDLNEAYNKFYETLQ